MPGPQRGDAGAARRPLILPCRGRGPHAPPQNPRSRRDRVHTALTVAAGLLVAPLAGAATAAARVQLRRGAAEVAVLLRGTALRDLPAANRVNWRGDSALTDGADVGRDLTGGWYDAGDHVKFGLPMAVSATMLAWGAVEYRDAYAARASSTAPAEQPALGQRLLHQGAPAAERALWAGRQRRRRPQVVGTGRGHADGAARRTRSTRPAPARTWPARRRRRWPRRRSCSARPTPTYADTLLSHAKQLYTFADTYRGKYSDCITDAPATTSRGAATRTNWCGARSGSTGPPATPPTWPRRRA